MFKTFQSTFETHHNLDLELQEKMSDPIVFLDETKGDTMYFHQAMSQEDSGDFAGAVVKEVNGHIENAHGKLVPIKSVPEDTNILPYVWYM